jgi:hypothetical protein
MEFNEFIYLSNKLEVMSDLISDGDLFLPIRTKLNDLNNFLKVAETDVLITAGAVTSIPIVTTTQNLLNNGEKVTIVDPVSGVTVEVTLSADAGSGSESLSITSHTFTADVPVGSGIYFKMVDLLAKVYVII